MFWDWVLELFSDALVHYLCTRQIKVPEGKTNATSLQQGLSSFVETGLCLLFFLVPLCNRHLPQQIQEIICQTVFNAVAHLCMQVAAIYCVVLCNCAMYGHVLWPYTVPNVPVCFVTDCNRIPTRDSFRKKVDIHVCPWT